MSFEGLTPLPDAAAGSWIAPRLKGFGGRVHCVVPDGYDAYARILHPAEDETGEPVTWAEVSRRTGRVAHPLMQWNSIAEVVQHVRTEGRRPRRYEVIPETSAWPARNQASATCPGSRWRRCSTCWPASLRQTPSASTRSGKDGAGCTRVPGLS